MSNVREGGGLHGAGASLNLDHVLMRRDYSINNQEAAILRQRLIVIENLYQRNISGHYGCVNALEFSHGGKYLASGESNYEGGMDNLLPAITDC